MAPRGGIVSLRLGSAQEAARHSQEQDLRARNLVLAGAEERETAARAAQSA
jgi:hypothetical protein